MRAKMFGFDDFKDKALKKEPDYEEIENFKWNEIAEKHLGEPCSRIGYLEDDIGFEIFVTEKSHIYLAHSEVPEFAFKDYIDFLNSTILSTRDRAKG